MTQAQLQALHTELATDPKVYGYQPFVNSGADETLAGMVNHIRDGSPLPAGVAGPSILDIKRSDIAATEVLEAIALADFAASPAASGLAWFQSVTQQPAVRLLKEDGTDTLTIANLKLLVTGAPSRTRLAAVSVRAGSRGEQLFGAGVHITNQDVAAARLLP